MDIGIVFWAVIAYSLIGWFSFRMITNFILNRLLRASGEKGISSAKLIAIASFVVIGTIASGPMTWGNAFRSWLIKRDTLREAD